MGMFRFTLLNLTQDWSVRFSGFALKIFKVGKDMQHLYDLKIGSQFLRQVQFHLRSISVRIFHKSLYTLPNSRFGKK